MGPSPRTCARALYRETSLLGSIRACERPRGAHAAGAPRSPAPADTVLDLSMRLTAGFVQRLLHPPGPLPAAWAAWAALAAARRTRMCTTPACL